MSMVTEAPLKNAIPTDQELIDFVVREARLIDQQRFDEWLDMYAGDEYQGLARDCAAALDEQFTRRGGEGRVPALAACFTTATRLEADFWAMGLAAAA